MNIENQAWGLPVKKSKKWVWVVGVLILLIVAGYFVNEYRVNFKIERYTALYDDSIYLVVRCIEYCPYSEIYNEERDSGDSEITKSITRTTNKECLASCEDRNVKPLRVLASDLRESVSSSFYRDNRNRVFESYTHPELPSTECTINALLDKGKDCLFSETDRIERLEGGFVETSWSDITLNFTSLACSPEGIDIGVDVIEGKIIGIQFLVGEEGATQSIEKIEDFNGMNYIRIEKEEYSDNTEYSIGNPDKISIAYIVESDAYASGKRIESYSSRYCE